MKGSNCQILSVIGLVMLGLMVGCGCIESKCTRIKELKSEAGRYLDQECMVWGVVTYVLDIPILNYDAFKINDGSGEMWIFTTEGAPPDKVKVKVRGDFKELISIPLPIKVEITHYIKLKDMEFID